MEDWYARVVEMRGNTRIVIWKPGTRTHASSIAERVGGVK
jgi:hypothetical protein